jgi:hypothetical protein
VTPFYDDNDEARRKNRSIEDSTMPKKLNDDIAYHGFRIALGGERENLYSARLLKQVSAETRAKFEARLTRDGFAYLFLYDQRRAERLVADADAFDCRKRSGKSVENLLAPIGKGEFALNVCRRKVWLTRFAICRKPDYGVALINNGTPAVSLENPNTLTLFLTHTAIFPGVNLPFEFVPENKTHVFTYALYPHAKRLARSRHGKSRRRF